MEKNENSKKSTPQQNTPPRIPALDIVDKTQQEQPNKLSAKTCKAKSLVSGTTKLENVIFDPKKNPALYDSQNTAGDFETKIGNVKNNPINTVASIDFDKMKSLGVSISHENWLTPFDREILSVASSLYAAGNKYQSPLMIYQALSGNREDVKLTPDMRSKIIKSLKKLRMTDINIDSSQEEKVGWNKKGHYEGALLPSERIEVMTLNGQEVVECIHFLRNSPLYEYNAERPYKQHGRQCHSQMPSTTPNYKHEKSQEQTKTRNSLRYTLRISRYRRKRQ